MLVDGSSVLKAFVSLSEQNSSMCYFYCSCFSLPRSISRNTAFIWKIFFVTEIVSLHSVKEGFHHPGLSKEGGVGALSFSAPIRAQWNAEVTEPSIGARNEEWCCHLCCQMNFVLWGKSHRGKKKSFAGWRAEFIAAVKQGIYPSRLACHWKFRPTTCKTAWSVLLSGSTELSSDSWERVLHSSRKCWRLMLRKGAWRVLAAAKKEHRWSLALRKLQCPLTVCPGSLQLKGDSCRSPSPGLSAWIKALLLLSWAVMTWKLLRNH